MKVYQNLYVDLKDYDHSRFFDELAGRASPPWARDRTKEEDTHQLGEPTYIFTRQADTRVPGALVALAKATDGRWYVTNIVPEEFGSLSYDQYNRILMEFYEQVLQHLTDEHAVSLELTSGDLEIDDLLVPETARLLRLFSAAANKSSGGSHPLDQERWLRFLSAAHRDHATLTADLLRRFLTEDGWPEDAAIKLASEYEFALDLLQLYDEQHR